MLSFSGFRLYCHICHVCAIPTYGVYRLCDSFILPLNVYVAHAHSFMGRGIVEAPMGEVAQFIKRIESTFTWDKFVVVSPALQT